MRKMIEVKMERLTDTCWRNLDPWECCGQDHYCQRGCHDEGGCTNGCIVPELYDRLAAYEDTGLLPEVIADFRENYRIAIARFSDYKAAELQGRIVIVSSNDPLTLDKLLEMDGEPVFVTSAIGEHPEWYIVDVEENELKNPWGRITLENWDEGYPYKAYRRNPENTQV